MLFCAICVLLMREPPLAWLLLFPTFRDYYLDGFSSIFYYFLGLSIFYYAFDDYCVATVEEDFTDQSYM